MFANVLVAAAEQSDQQRELDPANEGCRQDHDRRDQGPPRHLAQETRTARRPERRGENGQAIAQGKGDDDAAGLKGASQAKAAERGRRAAEKQGIGRPAQPDARQRHGQNQPEGKGGSAKDRAQHAVPNQFHEEEGEPGNAGHEIDKVRRRRCGGERGKAGPVSAAVDPPRAPQGRGFGAWLVGPLLTPFQGVPPVTKGVA